MNSPHKGQWHRALVFSLICTRTNGLVNNREAGDLIGNRVPLNKIYGYPIFKWVVVAGDCTNYDVTVMKDPCAVRVAGVTQTLSYHAGKPIRLPWDKHNTTLLLFTWKMFISTDLTNIYVLESIIGGTSCGFTNIKSNWNMSRSDWKCSPVHKYSTLRCKRRAWLARPVDDRRTANLVPKILGWRLWTRHNHKKPCCCWWWSWWWM